MVAPFGIKIFFSYTNNWDKILAQTELWATVYISLAKDLTTCKIDQHVAKKCLSLKAKHYSLRCSSKTSLRRPEKSHRCLWGGAFNISHWRRLKDLQISSLWDVSETLHGTSQRRIWGASRWLGCISISIEKE